MEIVINNVPVRFPYEPYKIQRNYMEKVIKCLQNQENGVLESPTGTGKTLSLLCSSLAWLEMKKAQIQIEERKTKIVNKNEDVDNLLNSINKGSGNTVSKNNLLGLPIIIYASRTHSQLSQAMQELKKTSYKYMKASILGSRDQMCIHRDIMQENDSNMKIQLCKMKTKVRACHFYNRVESKKDDAIITELNVVDIEDIVKLGQVHRFCPYFMSKELIKQSDIIFMPYNYLLDPVVRKGLGIELENNVVILDEAHNIEKQCEEAASYQIKSTDITLSIEEVTTIMKLISDDSIDLLTNSESPRDFTGEDLCVLKQILLDFEKQIDNIEIKCNNELTTFDGDFIFELLENAGIKKANVEIVKNLLDKLIQFLITVSDGPFQRKGNGLQMILDLITLMFHNYKEETKAKIKKCYKIFIQGEDIKKKRSDNWLSKATVSKHTGKILNIWCFSPGFGMDMLMDYHLRCLILTSGTLAPLPPLISELGLNVGSCLENPHVIDDSQVCVKILVKGPDSEPLCCNYQNRDNPKYINSLGRTIENLARVIPNGMLVFFSSYPIMQKYQQYWQENEIWSNITQIKTIYVEPKDKNSFNSTMKDYYEKIKDPKLRGAIFMGVCRGKVSEGLDFADMNGRAVLITGLPFPPLKDARVILKKSYLDENIHFGTVKGNEWYTLEATRAVNQAIGRVIRHKNDYGAIILLDSRFNNERILKQMSKWLQKHVKVAQNFGEIAKDLRIFFRNAEKNLPIINTICLKENNSPKLQQHQSDFGESSSNSIASDEVVNKKRTLTDKLQNALEKKKKIVLIPNSSNNTTETPTFSTKEYIIMVQNTLTTDSFKKLINALSNYKTNNNINELISNLDDIFLPIPNLKYLLHGLEDYIKVSHKEQYSEFLRKIM